LITSKTEDIKITYSEGEPVDSSSKHFGGNFELRHPVAALTQDQNAYGNFEAWNKMYGDERSGDNVIKLVMSAIYEFFE
jgi:hypothetical protein